MSIKVLQPGPLTTVQDLGRTGFQKFGVIVSGAVDTFALKVANLLVGNEETEAGLEMTLNGARLLFEEEAVIAICGGAFQPLIQGIPVGMWKPILIKKGSELSFAQAMPSKAGARVYLAVSGGFSLPSKMGSKSTYLRAKMGGFEGRPLKKGDLLPFAPKEAGLSFNPDKLGTKRNSHYFSEASWSLSHSLIPKYSSQPQLRVLPGKELTSFTEDSIDAFFNQAYKVTPQSDRMGYRLDGPSLTLKEKRELLSEPTAFGTIQVPSGGQPIVLLSDRQTTGGYPCIGYVITADLPLIAQTKPGDSLTFIETTVEKAQALLIKQEKELLVLKKWLNIKLRH
ncbi:MAG TPA: biotin-dependent carboxyltransferase family protein [Sporolactobacillaceae bacterium]|nr:biotin-dependent carboxyltransferase family protein [Sporolactobacillaceae bacterium]